MKLMFNGKTIKEQDIINLERKWQVTLPASYKEFLLKNNGGQPEVPSGVEILGFPEVASDLNFFLGIRPEDKDIGYDLDDNIQFYNQCHPEWFIFPGARDSSGGVFGFEVVNGVAGAVLFYDLGNPHLYEVAADFQVFMEKITETDMEEVDRILREFETKSGKSNEE